MDRRRVLKALGLAATSMPAFLGRTCQTVALSGRAHASELEAKAGTASPYFPQHQDFAARAGLNSPTIIGQVHHKKYILETMGGGIALFDYDSDGWLDIFLVNGSQLEGFPAGQEPTNHLYRNNHDGTFTDVTQAAGLTRSGWGQGVCIGDFDNDGHVDLFVTYYGKNVLYRNNGDGTFTDITEKAGLRQSGDFWNTGCAFVDYDRDGYLDLFVANYVAYADAMRVPPECSYKGVHVNCGPLGLKGSRNFLYHNNRNGTFTEVSEKSGIWTPKRITVSPPVFSTTITTAGRISMSLTTPRLACCSTTTTMARSPKPDWRPE